MTVMKKLSKVNSSKGTKQYAWRVTERGGRKECAIDGNECESRLPTEEGKERRGVIDNLDRTEKRSSKRGMSGELIRNKAIIIRRRDRKTKRNRKY